MVPYMDSDPVTIVRGGAGVVTLLYTLYIRSDIRGPCYSGGARGGLGATAPRRSMLAPRRKVKSDFFGDFWHL